jgi:hypothetical protein
MEVWTMRVLANHEVEAVSGGDIAPVGEVAGGAAAGAITGFLSGARSGNLAMALGMGIFGGAIGAALVMVKYAMR